MECVLRVDSVPAYLNAIEQAFNALCNPTQETRCELWFRGQQQQSFNLTPTIARGGRTPLLEAVYFSKFKSYAIPFVIDHLPTFPLPNGIPSYWHWLFLMRHYGVPTRLLDWSRDALVALFFATDPADPSVCPGIDAAVWVLNPVTLNTAYTFNAFVKPGYIPNVEEPEFNKFLGPTSVLTNNKPAAAIGPLNNARIIAQRGTFTVFPLVEDITPLNLFTDASAYLFKICIASEAFDLIRTQLESYGVNRLAIFPDLQNVAEVINQQVVEEGILPPSPPSPPCPV